MHALSAAALLDLREHGAGLHAIDRALLVLGAAEPERDGDALARLPLGVRDAHLLAVRRQMLGDRVDAEAHCPACAERLELALDCREMMAGATPPPPQWQLESGDWVVTLRPLDSIDTARAAASGSIAEASLALLRQCVVHAARNGVTCNVDDLPSYLHDAIAESLAVHDPGAEWLLDFDCPACGHRWHAAFDVAEFVWRELAERSERLLGDVHVLARAYGWREADILALPAARRAAYVALVAG